MEKREVGPASPFLSLLFKHTHLCPGLSNLSLDKKGEREVAAALWRMDGDRKLLRTRVRGAVKENLEDVGVPHLSRMAWEALSAPPASHAQCEALRGSTRKLVRVQDLTSSPVILCGILNAPLCSPCRSSARGSPGTPIPSWWGC